MPAESFVNQGGEEQVEALLGIWREVLVAAAPTLDADSNFFLSGGDSLDLARILVRVRERLGIELDQREVRELSTPRRMARRCAVAAAARRHLATTQLVARRQANAGPYQEYPCSLAQCALWTAEQMAGHCGLYNTAVVLHLSGVLDVPVLSRALGLLLRRHEVLRSRLLPDSRARRPVARIDTVPELALLPQAVEPAALRRHLQDAAAAPFNLACGPLWRFRLFTTGPGNWALLIGLHHAVTDGWSGGVLLQTLVDAYNALLLDPSRASVRRDDEFARWCRRQAEPASAEVNWWRSHLDGADRLPGWPPTGAHGWPFVMGCEQALLTQEISARIQQAARARRLPPSVLFLTALRLVFLQWAGLRDACIAVPVNVRDSSAQEAAVGYFVNLVVTRATVADAMHPNAALACVSSTFAEALSHRGMPFAELVRALRPETLPSGNAWSDVLFAFQNLPQVRPQLAGLQLQLEFLPLPYGQHPFKLEVVCLPAQYLCRLEYAQACLSAEEARAMISTLATQVEALLADAARNC